MKLISTDNPDILILEPKIFEDARGFFYESFNEKYFSEELGIKYHFVQDNHSRSSQSILRGLHYQIQHPQGKLVRVVMGEIYDVAVDLRRYSPNFGKWVGTHLNTENKRIFWIPPGFAHGFLTLSSYAEVVYKTTDFYQPAFERTILWNDPKLGINWPIENEPILSKKDQAGQYLQDAEIFEY